MTGTVVYRVRILPSGDQFDAASDTPILDAAEAAGITLPYGCRQGQCKQCRAVLVDGHIGYPDNDIPAILSDADLAARIFLPCRAQALSAVTMRPLAAGTAMHYPTHHIRTQQARVSFVEALTTTIYRVQLAIIDHPPLRYVAGQYTNITLGGETLPFSIANAPHESNLIELHIRRTPQNAHWFATLQQGNTVTITDGAGTMYLRPDGEGVIIFAAGGTGIAPLRAMLAHAHFYHLTRPIVVYWGITTETDAYIDFSWATEKDTISLIHVIGAHQDNSNTTPVADRIIADQHDLATADCYAAGPMPMVQKVYQQLVAHGLSPSRFFADMPINGPTD